VTRRRAILFDRDGVLNEQVLINGAPGPPPDLAGYRLLPTALAAVECAHTLGYAIAVVTNQPDVGRGLITRQSVERIHTWLGEQAPAIERIYVCYHVTADRCRCRKPAPGMLEDAAVDLGLDLAHSWLIGDRWVDILAAQRAGCRSVLVETFQSWLPSSAGDPPADLRPTITVPDTLSAVVAIAEADRLPTDGSP